MQAWLISSDMYREKTKEEDICFEIDGIRIQPANEVKLLAVTRFRA